MKHTETTRPPKSPPTVAPQLQSKASEHLLVLCSMAAPVCTSQRSPAGGRLLHEHTAFPPLLQVLWHPSHARAAHRQRAAPAAAAAAAAAAAVALMLVVLMLMMRLLWLLRLLLPPLRIMRMQSSSPQRDDHQPVQATACPDTSKPALGLWGVAINGLNAIHMQHQAGLERKMQATKPLPEMGLDSSFAHPHGDSGSYPCFI